jgi:hypothetical protein
VRFKLRGVDPKAKYRISWINGDKKLEMSGEELSQKGLLVAIDAQPGVAIVKYQKISDK